MILRPLAASLFVLFVLYLMRELQPSRYGKIFGCLLLYLPVLGKFQFNLAPGVNLVTLFLIALLVQKQEEEEERTSPGEHEGVFRGFLYAWIAVCLWGFLLGLSGHTPALDLVVLLKRWLDPVFACLLAFRIVKQEDRRFVLACVLLGYLIVGVQGLRSGLDYGDKVRIGGLLEQPNDLGAFLAMYAPFAFIAALFLTAGRIRYLLLGGVAVGGWALLFTQSRAALIGLPIGILAVLFRSGRGGLGLLGLLLAGSMWLFPEVLPEQVTARFAETYVEKNLPGASAKLEESAASRMNIWRGALNMIADNPLGIGFGQFQQEIEHYAKFQNEARDAHNFYILVGAEFGIGGLVVLLLMLWKVVTISWAVSRQSIDPLVRPLGLGMFASALTLIVVNCFGSRMMTLQVSTYFWVLAALLMRAYDDHFAITQAQERKTIRARLRERLVGAEG
jgi:O-antigen ligase